MESSEASPSLPLNANAASTSGNGSSQKEAGNRRGRKARPHSTQSNTMTNYMTPVMKQADKPKVNTLGKRLDKRTRAPDSDDEVDENQENKSARIYASPSNEDEAMYKDLAKTMHKTGRLTKEKAVVLNKQLLRSLEKEKKYLKDCKKTVMRGEKGPSVPSFKLQCQYYKAQQWRLANKLSDLADTEAKAVDYISPNATLESTDTSSEDSCVFTDEGVEKTLDPSSEEES